MNALYTYRITFESCIGVCTEEVNTDCLGSAVSSLKALYGNITILRLRIL